MSNFYDSWLNTKPNDKYKNTYYNYLDGGQNTMTRSYEVPFYSVNFDKQCSYDSKKCEQCHVVGLEGEKKYWNCNQECARSMQCKTFPTPPLSYITPIPRDQLTLTHQPEFHPYYPESHLKTCNKRCQRCNNFYLDDHRKHICSECESIMYNHIKPIGSYQDTFFYKNIKEY